MNAVALRVLTTDLRTRPPRSARAPLAGYPVIAARMVDKCRASLLGINGPYHYDCPLDRIFFGMTGLRAEPLRELVASGADDRQIAAWMDANATKPKAATVSWGRLFALNPFLWLMDLDDWWHGRRGEKSRKTMRDGA